MVRTFILSAILLSSASAVTAQASPAKPAAQPLGGPVIPGVCLLFREAIFANAAVGKAASTRLQELTRTAHPAPSAGGRGPCP